MRGNELALVHSAAPAAAPSGHSRQRGEGVDRLSKGLRQYSPGPKNWLAGFPIHQPRCLGKNSSTRSGSTFMSMFALRLWLRCSGFTMMWSITKKATSFRT